jgi:hypothetical protein
MTNERKNADGALYGKSTSMSPARRRLLRGGLSVAPVVMASAPRSVMAGGVCVPASSFASVNASRPDLLFTCSGRSPGYWKNHANWPNGYFPVDQGPNKATLFNAVFTGSTGYPAYPGKPAKTLLDVLQDGGGDRDAVARHIVAALLNAAAGLTKDPVLSVSGVRAIWSSFDQLGYYEPTAGIRWYADSANVSGTGGIIPWLKSTMPV